MICKYCENLTEDNNDSTDLILNDIFSKKCNNCNVEYHYCEMNLIATNFIINHNNKNYKLIIPKFGDVKLICIEKLNHQNIIKTFSKDSFKNIKPNLIKNKILNILIFL